MSQELEVLRCYSCKKYQVHIVKKIRKWECKICGEKQSAQRTYARGSGKHCREVVQQLNMKQCEEAETEEETLLLKNEEESENIVSMDSGCSEATKGPSKWSKYLE